ncbi:MAG TPA: hypothetical protein VKY51_02405 [Fredinandcohnia sp.]|nr:hypothetical protein [Fredinandcohnia sp.]
MPAPKTLVLLARRRIGTNRRLLRAARERGIEARLVDPAECAVYVDGRRFRLVRRGKPMPPPDAVVPRLASAAPHALAVLHHFELAGSRVLNRAQAIAQSRHPMQALQLLADCGIGVSRTVMGRDARSVRRLVELVGGLPVLLRVMRGGERRASMICETPASLEAALEVLFGLGQDIVVQRYPRHPGERDVRILVVGGTAVCAVRRIPQTDRLARSLEPGARYETIAPSSKIVEAAEATARLLGLEVAAVDMLDRGAVPKVFQVEVAPPLLALERATGRDLAGTIVDWAVSTPERGWTAVSGT